MKAVSFPKTVLDVQTYKDKTPRPMQLRVKIQMESGLDVVMLVFTPHTLEAEAVRSL